MIPKPNGDISDIDLIGVCVAPKSYYIGLPITSRDFSPKQYQDGMYDVMMYEVRKFFKLLLTMNPNLINIIWLREEDYVYKNAMGNLLIENRDIFSSKQAYESFVKCAKNQIGRMKPNEFSDYMGKKRKDIVEQFGYDISQASHLIRFLRMGIEFLNTGTLTVYRPDASELKEIKMGKWSLEKVKAEAQKLFKDAELAYRSSKLPEAPNMDVAETLLMEIVEAYV